MSEPLKVSAAPVVDPPHIVRPSQLADKISYLVFWGIHWGCLAAIWTGISFRAAALGFFIYWMRMFAITGGYHRYFSHRTYKTSRFFQFVLAVMGTMTVQKGPVWWAAKHRHHHKYSDMVEDVHSPRQRGFWYSHVGWVTGGEHSTTDLRVIKDFAKFPELLWIGKYHFLAPVLLAVFCFWFAGWSGLVVGFGWSLVAAWHWTFTINSLSHVWGGRRYETDDDSRNNWVLAIFTMGEGWHNNHHHYMHTVKQGFYWWEFDVTYYILRALSAVGIVWDLKMPPARVFNASDKQVKPTRDLNDEDLAPAIAEPA